MTYNPSIFAFAASARAGSLNQKLLKNALALLPEHAQLDEEEDYRNLTLPPFEDAYFDDDAVPAQAIEIAERIAKADILFIASPEYNWSMPGSLKNTIDWVSRINIEAFKDKPVLLFCATPSSRGGTVGLGQLRVPLEVLGAWVYPQLVCVGKANEVFDDQGQLTAKKERSFLENCVTDFIAKANALVATQ